MSQRASKANVRRSKVRALVEHPFARMKGPMDLVIRMIGIARATTKRALADRRTSSSFCVISAESWFFTGSQSLAA